MDQPLALQPLTLYSYWRSTAAYRVRIGLGLKGLEHAIVPVDLARDGGQHHAPAYLAMNPQGFVPSLAHGKHRIHQSLAILEYIDETWAPASLLPAEPLARARVRTLAQLVACDIHPLNNLRVLQYLERTLDVAAEARQAWIGEWITRGFDALEAMLGEGQAGGFCHGESPSLADCCLVPQVYNARRFNVGLSAYPRILAIDARCAELPAFKTAHPAAQPDAPAAG